MKRAAVAVFLLWVSGTAGASSAAIQRPPVYGNTALAAPEIDTPATELSFFFSALLVMRGRRPRGPR